MCEGRSPEPGEVVIGSGVGSVRVAEAGTSGDPKEAGMVEACVTGALSPVITARPRPGFSYPPR